MTVIFYCFINNQIGLHSFNLFDFLKSAPIFTNYNSYVYNVIIPIYPVCYLKWFMQI